MMEVGIVLVVGIMFLGLIIRIHLLHQDLLASREVVNMQRRVLDSTIKRLEALQKQVAELRYHQIL